LKELKNEWKKMQNKISKSSTELEPRIVVNLVDHLKVYSLQLHPAKERLLNARAKIFLSNILATQSQQKIHFPNEFIIVAAKMH
jgi:hypothetical protein